MQGPCRDQYQYPNGPHTSEQSDVTYIVGTVGSWVADKFVIGGDMALKVATAEGFTRREAQYTPVYSRLLDVFKFHDIVILRCKITRAVSRLTTLLFWKVAD